MRSNEETTAADPHPGRCNKEGKKKKNRRRKRRRRRCWKVWVMPCFQNSCFGTTTPHGEEAVVVVAGDGDRQDDADHRSSKSKHSGWFWMRKPWPTVPVDSSLPDDVGVKMKPQVETERAKEVNLPVQAPAIAVDNAREAKPSLFRRLFAKVRCRKARETGTSELQPPEVINSAGPHDSNADVGPVRAIALTLLEASRMSAEHRPGSQSASNPPAAATTSSGSGSLATLCPVFSSTCRKRANPEKKSGETSTGGEEPEGVGTSSASEDAALITLMLLVLSLIVGGRAVAIVCTCTCFYLIPSFRRNRATRRPSRSISFKTRRGTRKGRVA